MHRKGKKQKLLSNNLKINLNQVLQEVEQIQVTKIFSQKSFIRQLKKEIFKQKNEYQKQMGCLIRTNRLIVNAYELHKNLSESTHKRKTLMKICDQILMQIQEVGVNYIQFDHRYLYKNLFQIINEENQMRSQQCLNQLNPRRILNLNQIKNQIILVKKDILLKQIQFLISYNSFTTSFLNKPKIDFNQKKISFINALRRVSNLNIKKNRSSELHKKQILDIHQKKMQSTLQEIRLSIRKSQYHNNILQNLKLNNKIREDNICYNITWDNLHKQYHNLFRQKTMNQQYNFIEDLNKYVKKLIQSKQQTSISESLKQNFIICIGMIILFSLGFFLLMLSDDSIVITIAMNLIIIMMIYLIFKLINQQIYSTDSYRRDISKTLQKRFETTQSNFILELCEDSLNIKVLSQQIK